MTVICYPHRQPLSTKQVKNALFGQNKFQDHTFCITATSNVSRLPVQVLLILPNLWILGFAMSVPQVEHFFSVFLDFFIEMKNKFLGFRIKAK